jgi:hypothetical protein
MLRSLLKLAALLAPTAILFACGSSTSSSGAGGHTTTTTTASTSSTTAITAACKDSADQTIVNTKDIPGITQTCATQNLGNDANTRMCIKTQTGLSDNCVTCFDQEVSCVISHCVSMCSSDPMGAACSTCRATNCDPAFISCSGLPATAPGDAGTG